MQGVSFLPRDAYRDPNSAPTTDERIMREIRAGSNGGTLKGVHGEDVGFVTSLEQIQKVRNDPSRAFSLPDNVS